MPVHKPEYKKIVEYLRQLGLLTDQVEAYLYLLQNGPHTVLALSRGLKTGRTKLYPLLDELADKQLITAHERHYGTSYEAAHPVTLEFLVNQQEQAAQALRSGLPAALHSLKQLHLDSPTTSTFIEYRDLDGIKQMYWNLNQARGNCYILELPAIRKQIGAHLAEKLRSAMNRTGTSCHILTNQKSPPAHARYIDPAVFRIEFEAYVYNNVVSLISCDHTKLYGIELHNQQFARHYSQLCQVLWRQAVI